MRVFVLKHKRVEEAALLIRPHLSEAASVTLTQKLNAMTVTDRPEKLDQIGKVLAGLRRAAARLHVRGQARAGARRRARPARSRRRSAASARS